MYAALLREIGGVPEVVDVAEPKPEGARVVVDIRAAGLNPLDISVASGKFYGGTPPLPYIPGCEAVVEMPGGRRAHVFGDGLGVQRDGTLAECATVVEDAWIPLPDDVDDALAVACGIAGLAGWLPLTQRAPVRAGDRVLVLGATGCAGSIAVQAARLLGAERVVAAGRNPERLERARKLGADDIVDMTSDGLVDALREACGGDGPTLVFDPLWDGPVTAATEAAARGARIVQVGQSAGPEATLTSSAVRGKQLEILGYSNFALPPDVVREGYLELLGHVTAKRVTIDAQTYELDQIAEAWRRQAEGPGAKLVVTI